MNIKSYIKILTCSAMLAYSTGCTLKPFTVDPDLMFDINGDGISDAVKFGYDPVGGTSHAYVIDGKNIFKDKDGNPVTFGVGTLVRSTLGNGLPFVKENKRTFAFGNFDGKPGLELRITEHHENIPPDSATFIVSGLNSALK